MNITLKTIFSKDAIIQRAQEFWDYKTPKEKIKLVKKYKHISGIGEYTIDSWLTDFALLNHDQHTMIVKGELIRTYDSLPNIDKTRIKQMFKLSIFSSKWYKLPHKDKSKLLNYFL